MPSDTPVPAQLFGSPFFGLFVLLHSLSRLRRYLFYLRMAIRSLTRMPIWFLLGFTHAFYVIMHVGTATTFVTGLFSIICHIFWGSIPESPHSTWISKAHNRSVSFTWLCYLARGGAHTSSALAGVAASAGRNSCFHGTFSYHWVGLLLHPPVWVLESFSYPFGLFHSPIRYSLVDTLPSFLRSSSHLIPVVLSPLAL